MVAKDGHCTVCSVVRQQLLGNRIFLCRKQTRPWCAKWVKSPSSVSLSTKDCVAVFLSGIKQWPSVKYVNCWSVVYDTTCTGMGMGHLPSVSSSSCSCNVFEALNVRNTCAHQEDHWNCSTTYTIHSFNRTHFKMTTPINAQQLMTFIESCSIILLAIY